MNGKLVWSMAVDGEVGERNFELSRCQISKIHGYYIVVRNIDFALIVSDNFECEFEIYGGVYEEFKNVYPYNNRKEKQELALKVIKNHFESLALRLDD